MSRIPITPILPIAPILPMGALSRRPQPAAVRDAESAKVLAEIKGVLG